LINSVTAGTAAVNPWNFASSCYIGIDPLAMDDAHKTDAKATREGLHSDVLGCGYATIPAAFGSPVPLAEGLTLRNERLELVISLKTGGIQSLRTHSDRNTRVSQRLAFHRAGGGPEVESQMAADRVDVTRNDALIGEIMSTGRLLDAKNELLARFTQRVRVARGLGPAIVQVELDPVRLPDGDIWKSYYASRLAWAEDALSVRRGEQWTARETERDRIESPEWVDIDDVLGRVTCFALGLPFHRRSAPNRLDTLLLVAGEDCRRFQFAIGLDQPYPTRGAVGTLSAGQPCLAQLGCEQPAESGWFLHLGAKNALVTHIAPLPAPAVGVRLRILETEGRETRTKLSGFREFKAARTTDFRANAIEVLSVAGGRAEFDIGPYQWIQIEAEW
jgi:alpha-mannosidase